MTQFTKIIYITLFTLIVLVPHFSIGHFFPFPAQYAQSLITVALFAVTFGIYLLHQRDIWKKDVEKQNLESKFSFSSKKLNDAYQYIGSVNRKLSLLSAVGTDLLLRSKETKKGRKAIFEELLMTAVITLSHSPWGMFRFINMATGRTEQEFIHATERYILLKFTVSNDELLQIKKVPNKIGEIDNLYVIFTSDIHASVQCCFVWEKGRDDIFAEISTLQAIIDQAQLFYSYLSEKPQAHKAIAPITK